MLVTILRMQLLMMIHVFLRNKITNVMGAVQLKLTVPENAVEMLL
jgi:hypothetical protein